MLIMAGLHGDEINGIEIVRRIREEGLDQPHRGTIITIPVLNIYGFIHFSRELPDGKDVNRSFPGSRKGSLASRVAYHLTKEILPHIDFGIDLHTGGDSRSNFPQIRCDFSDEENLRLAKAFNAPFTINSSLIPKSLRKTAYKMDKRILVYEGGESQRFDEEAIKEALDGMRRFLMTTNMIDKNDLVGEKETVLLPSRTWLRAEAAGMFRPFLYNGAPVKKGQKLGEIVGPFGDLKIEIESPEDGYVIGLNNRPIVHQGDALINIGKLS